jgi:hypothetical protein
MLTVLRQPSAEDLKSHAISLAESGWLQEDIWRDLIERMRQTGLDKEDVQTKLSAAEELLQHSEPWRTWLQSRTSGLPNPLAAGPSEPKGKAPALNPSFKTGSEELTSQLPSIAAYRNMPQNVPPPNTEQEELR